LRGCKRGKRRPAQNAGASGSSAASESAEGKKIGRLRPGPHKVRDKRGNIIGTKKPLLDGKKA